jgi:hypothetical protein
MKNPTKNAKGIGDKQCTDDKLLFRRCKTLSAISTAEDMIIINMGA